MKNLFKIYCLLFMALSIVSCEQDDDNDNNPNQNPLANVDYYIKGKKDGVAFNVTGCSVATNTYDGNMADPEHVQFFYSTIGAIGSGYGVRMLGLTTTTENPSLQEFYDFFAPGPCELYNYDDPFVADQRYFYLIKTPWQSDFVADQPNGSFVTISDTMHTTFTNPIGGTTHPAVKYKCTFQFQVYDGNTQTISNITEGEGVFVSVKY